MTHKTSLIFRKITSNEWLLNASLTNNGILNKGKVEGICSTGPEIRAELYISGLELVMGTLAHKASVTSRLPQIFMCTLLHIWCIFCSSGKRGYSEDNSIITSHSSFTKYYIKSSDLTNCCNKTISVAAIQSIKSASSFFLVTDKC